MRIPIPVSLQMRALHTSTPWLKIVPKNLKGKSASSQEWLSRHLNDPYVKKAQQMNFRARSAFKLIEMDEKLKILKPGQIVVECGAAPGAWTQVIVQKINSDGKSEKKRIGKVIGVDLLPISPLNGAIFLSNMDFTSPEAQSRILELLKPIPPPTETDSSSKLSPSPDVGVDIILSDMAPNASGDGGTDHTRIVSLARKALQFALSQGKPGSHFLTKLWDGNETQGFIQEISKNYGKVVRIKPPASRKDSAEIFLFASNKNKNR